MHDLRRGSSRVLLWLAAVVLVTSACRRQPAPQPTARAPGHEAVTVAKAAAPRVPDACDVVSPPEVEATVGVSLGPPRRSAGICEYRRTVDGGPSGETPTIGLRVHWSVSRPTFDAEVGRMESLLRAPRRPVPGVGEAAWQVGDALLLAFAEGHAVEVMGGEEGARPREERALAALALTRMASRAGAGR